MTITLTSMDVVGSAGVLLTLIAYGLLHSEVWRAGTLAYSLANVVGSALILASLVGQWNFSAFAMESCWLVISLFGVGRSFHRKRRDAAVAKAHLRSAPVG